MKTHLFYIAVIAIALSSCGAKKLSKTEVKTDSIASVVENTKIDSVSKETKTTNIDISTDEYFIEPIDTSKSIELTDANGKVTKVKNARIRSKKVKNNSNVVESKEIVKTAVKNLNTNVSVSKSKTTKDLVKEQFNWSTFILSFWWLWLIIILYLCYRFGVGRKLFGN